MELYIKRGKRYIRILSEKEFAKLLNISWATLRAYRLRKQSNYKYVRIDSRIYYYDAVDNTSDMM